MHEVHHKMIFSFSPFIRKNILKWFWFRCYIHPCLRWYNTVIRYFCGCELVHVRSLQSVCKDRFIAGVQVYTCYTVNTQLIYTLHAYVENLSISFSFVSFCCFYMWLFSDFWSTALLFSESRSYWSRSYIAFYTVWEYLEVELANRIWFKFNRTMVKFYKSSEIAQYSYPISSTCTNVLF